MSSFTSRSFARSRQRRVLARVALAEVVELRREPLQAVEQLVALGLESRDVDTLGLGLGHRGTSRFPRTPSTGPLSRTGDFGGVSE